MDTFNNFSTPSIKEDSTEIVMSNICGVCFSKLSSVDCAIKGATLLEVLEALFIELVNIYSTFHFMFHRVVIENDCWYFF